MFDLILCQRDFEAISNISQNLFEVKVWESDEQLKDFIKAGRKILLITSKTEVIPDLFNLHKLNVSKNTCFYHLSDTPHLKDGYFPGVETLDLCDDYFENSGIFLVVDSEMGGLGSFETRTLFSLDKYTCFDQYKKALFLDRDGVINIDKKYVYKVLDLEFRDGIVDFLKEAQINDYDLFVVTNQSGVARGMFKVEDVEIFNNEIKSRLKKEGIEINDFQISPYHFEKGVNEYARHSLMRKPFAGMILKLMHFHPTDLSDSLMIGDKVSDDLEIELLKTLHIKGEYDLSSAKSSVASNFKELKTLAFNS